MLRLNDSFRTCAHGGETSRLPGPTSRSAQSERIEHFEVTHVPAFHQQDHGLVQVRLSTGGLVHLVHDVRVTGIAIENDLNGHVGVEHRGIPAVEWLTHF